MNDLEQIIKSLNLIPHPEGGYFRETYRCEDIIPFYSSDNECIGSRNASTCIYFLLTSESFSAFHRIRQDEIWHFYDGSPLQLHLINSEGEHSLIKVGRGFERGEVPQVIVTTGSWFASEVVDEGSYSLIGCTVAPGFDFEDFELADRNTLLSDFPQHSEVIIRLTRI